ncbi:MAG: TerC family protein [Actinomycetota bacterium]
MEPWYLYADFIAFVLAMLLVDLKLFHAEEHEPTTRESATWVAIWVSLAVIFGIVVAFWKDGGTSAEYFAGYLIEYSLSVDNMFVFIVIFSYFKIPKAFQHQVLFYGILGAMIFRGIFIAAGVALIEQFEWVIYVFGAFLIFTAFRIAKGTEEVHPEDNPIIKFFVKRFPTTHQFEGQKLFTVQNGKRLATPLFVTLLFIEITDIVFAVDSIPAIFAITDDPFIILTSNVFAILGLRALYFLLAGSMDKFHLLKYGLAVILAFVGSKMLLEAADVHVPIWLSLAVIISVLLATVVLSLKIPPKHPHVIPEATPGAEAGGVAGVESAIAEAEHEPSPPTETDDRPAPRIDEPRS